MNIKSMYLFLSSKISILQHQMSLKLVFLSRNDYPIQVVKSTMPFHFLLWMARFWTETFI